MSFWIHSIPNFVDVPKFEMESIKYGTMLPIDISLKINFGDRIYVGRGKKVFGYFVVNRLVVDQKLVFLYCRSLRLTDVICHGGQVINTQMYKYINGYTFEYEPSSHGSHVRPMFKVRKFLGVSGCGQAAICGEYFPEKSTAKNLITNEYVYIKKKRWQHIQSYIEIIDHPIHWKFVADQESSERLPSIPGWSK